MIDISLHKKRVRSSADRNSFDEKVKSFVNLIVYWNICIFKLIHLSKIMELKKKTAIHIISVESPSKFWFRTKENEQKLNADIEAYMMPLLNSKTDYYELKLNWRVIVKWKSRFEVAQIKRKHTPSDSFFCLFENGRYRWIQRHDISPMPNRLINEANSTKLMGSLVGLAPVKMVS